MSLVRKIVFAPPYDWGKDSDSPSIEEAIKEYESEKKPKKKNKHKKTSKQRLKGGR